MPDSTSEFNGVTIDVNIDADTVAEFKEMGCETVEDIVISVLQNCQNRMFERSRTSTTEIAEKQGYKTKMTLGIEPSPKPQASRRTALLGLD